MAALYPEIEPFEVGMEIVSDIHTIYFERVGNPDGIPVVSCMADQVAVWCRCTVNSLILRFIS